MTEITKTASRMYIAVLEDVPDHMVPVLVAHTVLSAHVEFYGKISTYNQWFRDDYRKCVVRVSQKEFDKISQLPNVYLGYEKHTLDAKHSCAVVCPYENDEVISNVLKFAKLWKPINT